MLVIRVWGLPEELYETQLRTISSNIVKTVREIKELYIKDEKDVMILFPPNRMKWELGKEIIVEISLFDRPIRTEEIRNLLAGHVGRMVKGHFPCSIVECFVQTVQESSGFWTSEENRNIDCLIRMSYQGEEFVVVSKGMKDEEGIIPLKGRIVEVKNNILEEQIEFHIHTAEKELRLAFIVPYGWVLVDEKTGQGYTADSHFPNCMASINLPLPRQKGAL